MDLIRNPDMIEEVMHDEDRALGNTQPEQDNHETVTADPDGNQNSETKHLKLSQVQVWKCFPEGPVQKKSLINLVF